MNGTTFLGFDPAGVEVTLLCALLALALGGALAAGFLLLRRAGQPPARLAEPQPALHELGVLTLWRLGRGPAGARAVPRPGAATGRTGAAGGGLR